MKISLSFKLLVLAIISVLVLGAFSSGLPASLASQADTVRVWVDYQPGQRAQVSAALAQAGAQVHYHFADLDSYVVTLPAAALAAIQRNPNVAGVELDPVRSPVREQRSTAARAAGTDVIDPNGQVVPYGIDMVQAREIWDANYDGRVDKKAPTGAGRTVCIIDTGLFTGHADFAGVDLLGGYSQTNPDPALWTLDGYGHGTHVAGTIAAANNDVGVVGVTPGAASLYIIKIFGDDGLWVSQQHASDLADAALRCADAGANIISMSLSGTTQNGHEKRIFDQLYAEGVLHVAAASNDGLPDYHYPASYDSVVSVAALDASYQVADFSQYNDQVELAAPGVAVLSTIPYIATDLLTVDGVTYSANHIEYAAYGAVAGILADGGLCTSGGEWTGLVVLCERGEISFYDKVMNVQDSGGIAAVIYNNEPGNFLGTLGDGNTSTIIAISLSQADGQYLAANKLGLTASVESAIEWNVSGYEAWDGTSMATPHVSGVAALVWSANPGWTNVEIRNALDATAMDLGDPGRDVYYGFGLVQAYDAWVSLGGGKGPNK
ncbi:MAG: S8 family serine peptidase [Anaerolineales bacterium]